MEPDQTAPLEQSDLSPYSLLFNKASKVEQQMIFTCSRQIQLSIVLKVIN